MSAQTIQVYQARVLNRRELNEALDWLKDCDWQDMEAEDFDDLSDREIENAVARYFGGGLPAFQEAVKF